MTGSRFVGGVGALGLFPCSWQSAEVEFVAIVEERTPFVRCDANLDLAVDISDVIRILNSLFTGIVFPRCLAGEDCNGDGGVTLPTPGRRDRSRTGAPCRA